MKMLAMTALFAVAVSALTLVIQRAVALPMPVGSKISIQCNGDGTATLQLEPKK